MTKNRKKKCLVKNCSKIYYAEGYCKKHYEQFRSTGSPYRKNFINKNKICKAPECLSLAKIKGLCTNHYGRYKHHQSYEKLSPKGIHNINWKDGISEYPNHYQMKKNRLIILINNPKCEKCRKSATQIHHRSGDKSDHRLSNLMASCQSCNLKMRPKFNSKYRRLYGMNLNEMARKYGRSSGYYYIKHKENKLKDLLKIS